jgi:ubiquinone/menaquinone biosynthesis C-methylase UbiE
MSTIPLKQGSSLSNAASDSAFQAIAEDYDRIFTYSQIGSIQRQQVWSAAKDVFHSGDRILEIGCGTGYDAVHFAQQGIAVVACDESAAMIDVARTRTKGEDCGPGISFEVCANENLHLLENSAAFDGAFSNFGSLNCSKDLRPIVTGLASKVRPGGHLLLCLIGPFCLWEFAWYVFQGQLSKALRRIRRSGASAKFGQKEIRVFYPSVRSLRKVFSPEFSLLRWQGIGVAVPPSYAESRFSYHSKALLRLARLDEKIQKLPIARSMGDHILLEFERRA